ncbi:unnamed protein product [Cladocopium goreaui]|uniref:Uncharacterized protein n=1 Tax=Cladocopium goreaui TaxID=2562237 RepID=A0A9P1GA61_9DINO|nr:unnamed protein product [Cladocopium goreaui]
MERCSDCHVLCQTSYGGSPCDESPLVQMMMRLQEELRAYLFLFVEVASLGAAAPTCRPLRDFLWNDPAFWKVYAGVCFSRVSQVSDAASLRERFRIWLFHLEDEWATDFQEGLLQENHSDFGANYLQLFKDARYIASGLMPWDNCQQVKTFSDVSSTMLREYNPKQLDERWAAESFISKVEGREDVFSKDQVRGIIEAFEESLEKSILQQHLEGVEDAQWGEPIAEGAEWQSWDLEEDSEDSFGLGDE